MIIDYLQGEYNQESIYLGLNYLINYNSARTSILTPNIQVQRQTLNDITKSYDLNEKTKSFILNDITKSV